jgi:hypothetical protein
MDVSYQNQIQQAVAHEESKATASDVITLSSGVVLKRKKFSVLRISTLQEQFRYPEIPEIWDDERKRSIRNPDHPSYKRMKEEVDYKRGLAVTDAVIVFGTEVQFIPAVMPKPEEDSWIEELEAGGLQVKRESKLARYLAWVKFVAVIDDKDLNKILTAVMEMMGISESNIADAMDGFRS